MLPKKRDAGEAELGSISVKKNRVDDCSGSVVVGKNKELVMAPDSSADVEIDEDLHSRQLAVYGRETMRRLFGAHVLISGLQGLGVEVAKNVILAGVKSVTLHDAGNVELWDLSAQFYLTEEDVGRNRAVACAEKLKELNTAVSIVTSTGEVTEELLSAHQVVVFTDVALDRAVEIDDFCHRQEPRSRSSRRTYGACSGACSATSGRRSPWWTWTGRSRSRASSRASATTTRH